jgi:hypothetical protein
LPPGLQGFGEMRSPRVRWGPQQLRFQERVTEGSGMNVYRGATLALTVRSIGEGAQLTVNEPASGSRPYFAVLRHERGLAHAICGGGRMETPARRDPRRWPGLS